MLWHKFSQDTQALRFDPEQFEEACDFTAELLNNPAAWQPLEALVSQMDDPRVTPADMPHAMNEATGSWVSSALFSVTSVAPNQLGESGQVFLDLKGIPGDVRSIVARNVLSQAAEEVNLASAQFQSDTIPLLVGEGNLSAPTVQSLAAAGDRLIADAQLWLRLVEVFDDDPDSGEEGFALDNAAILLRGVAVSLSNRGSNFEMAQRLAAAAGRIARSASLKSSLEEDLRRLRYLEAYAKAVSAARSGMSGYAQDAMARVHQYKKTPEEIAESMQLQEAIRRMKVPQVAAKSAGGLQPKSIVGLVIAVVVVGGIVVSALSKSGNDNSASNGNISIPAGFTNPSSGVSNPGAIVATPQSGASSARIAEGKAIEAERARLQNVEADLKSQGATITSLSNSLAATRAQYPAGSAPAAVADQYNAQLLVYNSDVDHYNSEYATYSNDIDAFNRRVAAYNAGN